MHQGLIAADSRDAKVHKNFFGEWTLRIGNLATALVSTGRYNTPINYHDFWDLHNRVDGGANSWIDLMVTLHKSQKFDLGRIFASSLFYYIYYNFSELSGYGGSSWGSTGPKPDDWMKAAYQTLGEDKTWDIIRQTMLLQRFHGQRATEKDLEAHFISKVDVGSFEDGIMYWMLRSAPEKMRERYLDWVLDLARDGKDWFAFSNDHDGRRDYMDRFRTEKYKKTLSAAIHEHIEKIMIGSNGKYKNIADVFVAKGWLARDELVKLTAWSENILERRAAIDHLSPKQRGVWHTRVLSALGLLERADKKAIRDADEEKIKQNIVHNEEMEASLPPISPAAFSLVSLLVDQKGSENSMLRYYNRKSFFSSMYPEKQIKLAQIISSLPLKPSEETAPGLKQICDGLMGESFNTTPPQF
jgi:hypothetical protein